MPIVVDNVTMQECAGVDCDSINMVGVDADGTRVYDEVCYTPGDDVFYEDGTWIVPSGVTSVTLCMIGGGGGGGVNYEFYDAGGGGYSGAIVTSTVAVTEGSSIPIVCGAGGIGTTGTGGTGGQSKFGTTVANGGLGGTTDPSQGHKGEGASRATCFGTFNDGIAHLTGAYTSYGGQAGFGNGGNGGDGGISVTAGVRGAGGGGNSSFGNSGAGGRGVVKITW